MIQHGGPPLFCTGPQRLSLHPDFHTPHASSSYRHLGLATAPRDCITTTTANNTSTASITNRGAHAEQDQRFCGCCASRQAYHVSEAVGPASTSVREGKMNGATANGHAHIKLGHKQKVGKLSELSEQAPQTVQYDQLFSREAHDRLMPGLRILATAFNGLPGVIPFHGGLPPASAFPLSGIQLTLKDGTKIDITDPTEVVAAQQYNLTMKGHAPLLKWVSDHTQELHAPPSQHETIVTGGSNYTLEILMRLFMNPGDSILCEEYTYPHMPESLVLPVGYRSVGMELDEYGIIPSRLLVTLERMEAAGEQLPRLMYTVPTGQNPTGATQTAERKRQLYAICRRFNIIIIEDDPYFYLQYSAGEPPRGLRNLGESYLSMDVDQRVLRLDSFSKILAPGVRLGWLTAHPEVINKVLFHSHGVAMGPCSLSQIVVNALLDRFGREGFEAHIKDIQAQYARRAEIIFNAANKHLTGLADFAEPKAGMFLWVKLRGFQDAAQILSSLTDAKVIVVPGRQAYHEGPNQAKPCPFIRMSFVVSTEEQLEVGVERLGKLLQKFKTEQKPPLTGYLMDTPPSTVPMDLEELL